MLQTNWMKQQDGKRGKDAARSVVPGLTTVFCNTCGQGYCASTFGNSGNFTASHLLSLAIQGFYVQSQKMNAKRLMSITMGFELTPENATFTVMHLVQDSSNWTRFNIFLSFSQE